MTQFLLAFQFLSIFPVRISKTAGEQDLAGSMRYYPLVGAILGGMSALLLKAALWWFSPSVAVVSAVVGLIIFSGAFHLEGFADMCDGFHGHHDRQRILAIMKDSRAGPMAIVGVFCLLALKIALLASLETSRAALALAVAPAIGRWSMVWLCASSTYARPEGGTASGFIGHVGRRTFLTATCFCAVIAFLLLGVWGLAMMAAAAAGTGAFRRYVEKRIGGMTGDTLGACCELVEVLALALLTLQGIG
jgi:adenosylcobinamide-GDP ribazoletransferase